jgi:hypothetical protein
VTTVDFPPIPPRPDGYDGWAPDPPPHLTDDSDGGAHALGVDRAADFADFDAHAYDNATIQTLPPPKPLIGELLSLDSLAQLYGPSGHRKSFVALDWAEHVAHGLDWHGSTVHAGPVIYIAAEGAPGTGQRVRAWMEHHRDPRNLHTLTFQTIPANLFKSGTRYANFVAWCALREPVLVIFDTLARNSVGAEENSAKDMGQIIESLDMMRLHTGACVLLVHHTGKDTTRGARGSSALKGALDTEIETTSSGQSVTLKWTKSKDVAEPRPMTLEAVPVAESLVLIYSRSGPSLLTSGALDTLAALRDIEVAGGISSTAWKDAADVSSSTFFRHRKQLIDTGKVANVGTEGRPMYVSYEESK